MRVTLRSRPPLPVRAALLAAALATAALPAGAGAQPAAPASVAPLAPRAPLAPLALGLELVADGLAAPVFLTAPAGDARLFVVERRGRVRVVRDGRLLPAPLLDIGTRVLFAGERGLLGMAVAPDFAASGHLYLFYVGRDGDLTLERFVVAPDADTGATAAGVVLTIPHDGTEHHGGMIEFGPDGMLYVATGDGRCCGDPDDNAQDLGSLLGKLLRLDVRTPPYVVPAGNPFVGQRDRRPEIWASGLRNPWRFSFDAAEGWLYLGDVGQDEREEVNVAAATAAGLNYGWRRMEGSACFRPQWRCDPRRTLTYPEVEVAHPDACAVTGGYVYRGTQIPELRGHYLYSDYCWGWLRSFRMTEGDAAEHHQWAGVSLPTTVSLGRDGVGELYMIAGDAVWRIVRR